MAQKAAKQTAKRNGQALNRMHLISIGVNLFYILLRILIFRSSFSRKSLLLYVLLSAPGLAIEAAFEFNSRPVYNDVAGSDLRRAGQDLEAKGLTEWMWDVLYWTWGCVTFAAVLGDWAWFLYAAVPLYSAWLAYTTFGSVRQGLGMGQAAPQEQGGDSKGASKRQQKMEKRGGQQVRYR